jgi:hypothetical protein
VERLEPSIPLSKNLIGYADISGANIDLNKEVNIGGTSGIASVKYAPLTVGLSIVWYICMELMCLLHSAFISIPLKYPIIIVDIYLEHEYIHSELDFGGQDRRML